MNRAVNLLTYSVHIMFEKEKRPHVSLFPYCLVCLKKQVDNWRRVPRVPSLFQGTGNWSIFNIFRQFHLNENSIVMAVFFFKWFAFVHDKNGCHSTVQIPQSYLPCLTECILFVLCCRDSNAPPASLGHAFLLSASVEFRCNVLADAHWDNLTRRRLKCIHHREQNF